MDCAPIQSVDQPRTSSTNARPAGRVLLLLTATTYRAQAFVDAASRLNIEVVAATDMPRELAEFWQQPLGIDFTDLPGATERIAAFAAEKPLNAIIAVDDSGSLLAARASAALGLPHNGVAAAEAARDKFLMRTLLAQAGVASPPFARYWTSDDPQLIAATTSYPCVVKPLRLSGSRGVMRANNPQECVAAIARLTGLLNALDPAPEPKPFLIEDFIPGFEVALEGLINHGQLQVLALFDKPDPLDGPFFEETLYVTPSRLASAVQKAIADCAAAAAAALGLREGPMHAELRVNEQGPWIVELAGRSIGGLCSRTLRFGTDVSLEELILRQACGLPIPAADPAQSAGGVMMIPIPAGGIFKCVTGVSEAEQVPGIEEIQITAKAQYLLVPLPEGDSYLGFIFARGAAPTEVEAALRQAHGHLHFKIQPNIPLLVT
ncbi:MAG: phosphoribosylglycinamide synthetase [Chloroflexi bacterium]|nr:MAG: phosphoribosylglycinamide synthetase [Chloroflexota bacterium]